MVMMAYDRYGRAKPTPRDDRSRVPALALVLIVCAIVMAVVAALTIRTIPQEDAQETAASIKCHDSLAPTYTYDGECIRWYVLVDPDTNVQYLVNDRGGCTPRLDKFGTPMGVMEQERQ